MDFNQIRYFLALSDTLNFTRAAEQCFVSQPALTQAIKRLENELGGELIDRNPGHMELTNLGKSLRTHFHQIEQTRNLVRATAKAVIKGDYAELNLGLMCTIGPRALAPMLDAFQQKHPMISLVLHDVTPDKIPDLLLSGAIDGAFCSHKGPPNTKVVYKPLYQEPMVVAFPKGHDFEKLDKVSVVEITEARYVDRLHCEFRPSLLAFLDDNGLELEIAFRSQREDWIQDLISSGAGVSVLPKYSLLKPELDFRPIADEGFIRNIEFATASRVAINPALHILNKDILDFAWPTEAV